MCGIVGFSAQTAQVERLAAGLPAAMAALRHRGPDGERLWQRDGVALGHTRLSIIDLAGGAQPLISTDEQVVLVANGEIYNHIELRQRLEAAGARFQTGSDCEVILQGYVQWGDRILNLIEGMYAFALFDRTDGSVLLARDPLGMKPLYLKTGERTVSFGSEIKALLALEQTRAQVHAPSLAQFMECQHSLGRQTIVAGVERVLAGEAVRIRDGAIVKRWRHWDIRKVEPRRPDDPVAALDELMETVFNQHLRSDVPIGLFLSGGVDSTVLLGLMRRYGLEDIRTFSLGFPNSSVGDELDVATRLARSFNTRHEVITPSPETLLERFVDTVWAADDLMRDPASLPTSLLAETASRDMKVVFSGEGGDEAFAGYGRYRTGGVERWFKSLAYPGTGGFRSRGDIRGGLSGKLLNEALSQAHRGWRQALQQAWRSYPRQWTDLERMQALDLEHALPDNLLVKADRMLMAHGVEGRMPFVDRRIVEFGLALPDALKRDRKAGKLLIKRWAGEFMPAEHFAAKKRGFYVPIRDWWQGDRLARMGQCLLRNDAIGQWFKPDGVRALLTRQSSRGDAGRLLMALLQFAVWHRLFVESDGARPPAAVDPLEFLESTG